jgi:hypothetical protein
MNNINEEIKAMESALADLKAKAEAEAEANEPTLTPVSFDSKRELAQALLDGREFALTTDNGSTLFYKESGTDSPFKVRYGNSSVEAIDGIWERYSSLLEINQTPWYLNIPEEGVDCYVSDYSEIPDESNQIEKVVLYRENPGTSYFFKDSDLVPWKYAVPVPADRK